MSWTAAQVAFVVWRESMEALLVVGILHAWLTRSAVPAVAARGRRFLLGGVAAGLGTAVLLAFVILFFASLLEGEREDYFQIVMAGLAAVLILQMVGWMHRHGRDLKRDLERDAERAVTGANWLSLFLLAAIAVMREGSETVVFLYGILGSAGAADTFDSIAAVTAGFVLAGGVYWLLQFGGRRFGGDTFFRVTEVLLLALAASLLMTAVDRAIGLDLISPLGEPLWDTSGLLDDSAPIGAFVAALTGYRSRPDLTSILVYAGFWLTVVVLLRRDRHHLSATAS